MQRVSSRLLILACGLVVGAAFPRPGAADPGRAEVTWQQSEGVCVRLGIRDKFGALSRYEALFAVRGPDGKVRQARRSVSDSDWSYVAYPDDFDPWAVPGRYTWTGSVGDEVVIRGAFEFTTRKSYADEAHVER